MSTRNIVPRANGEGGLGTEDKHWGELYTEKDPKKKIVLDEFDEMREYYNNILLPLWKKLRIELEKYAVINLPT